MSDPTPLTTTSANHAFCCCEYQNTLANAFKNNLPKFRAAQMPRRQTTLVFDQPTRFACSFNTSASLSRPTSTIMSSARIVIVCGLAVLTNAANVKECTKADADLVHSSCLSFNGVFGERLLLESEVNPLHSHFFGLSSSVL